MFFTFFLVELLRRAGWPKERGVFKKTQKVNAMVLSSSISAVLKAAVGLGAYQPTYAARVLTQICSNTRFVISNEDDYHSLLDQLAGC